ncbi:hypothetical protein LPJ77_002744, partial [Coemansia sp. RSA 2523]
MSFFTNSPHQGASNRRTSRHLGASGMFDRMRTLVDNVTEAFDGPAQTRKDRLLDNWMRIQEYYTPQRQDDICKLSVTDTTIPHHMEGMLRELAHEILDGAQISIDEALAQPLEFGA